MRTPAPAVSDEETVFEGASRIVVRLRPCRAARRAVESPRLARGNLPRWFLVPLVRPLSRDTNTPARLSAFPDSLCSPTFPIRGESVSTRRHTSVLPRAAALARIGCRVGAIGLDGHQYQRASAESDYADHNQNDDDEHPHSGRTFLLNDDRYGLLGGLNCRASRHLGRLWRGCFRAPPKLIGIPPSNLIAFVDIRRDIRGPFMLKRQVLDT